MTYSRVESETPYVFLRTRKELVELGDHLNWSYSRWFAREEIESELREAGIRLQKFGDEVDGYAVGGA